MKSFDGREADGIRRIDMGTVEAFLDAELHVIASPVTSETTTLNGHVEIATGDS